MARACASLFFVFALALGWTATADEREAGGIAWMTDLDAARAKAASEGRPLLVVFT